MKAFFEARDTSLFVGRMTVNAFPLHVHENVEIAYVRSGTCDMQIGGAAFQLRPGDLAICFPLTPHSYDRLSGDCQGFAAFFLPDTIAEFANTFHRCQPVEPVIRREALGEEIPRLIERLMETPSDQPSPVRLAYLHLLLAHVLSGLRLRPADDGNERDLAARVIRHIYTHACERITLDSTARALGISRSHLSHIFAQQYRVNFRRFINAIRINKALVLMRDPLVNLTQVCYGCGYENMRTFRRAFTQETGMLPSEYLRRVREYAPGPENG